VAIIALTVPVVLPLVETLGYDPIWFGVYMVLLAEIGLVTPPMGLNVFVVARAAGRRVEEVFRGAFPYVIAMLLVALMFLLFPALILCVPSTMYNRNRPDPTPTDARKHPRTDTALLVDRADHAETWTLNLPDSRNPISDSAMVEALCDRVDAVNADPDVRAVVLTGAGTAFSAGGNVKNMVERHGMFGGSPYELRDG